MNGYGDAPLCCACLEGHADAARVLIAAGGDVNMKGYQSQTPLHSAARKGSVDTVRVLLDAGADIYALSDYGRTAADFARDHGHVHVAAAILARDVHGKVDDLGRTALHRACRAGCTDIVLALLEAGASHAARDARDVTPLHVACSHGDAAMVSALLAAGAKHDAQAGWRTPLQYACSNGKVAAVKLLLAAGADPNWLGGDPPIVMAADKGHLEIVQVLLAAGVKTGARTLNRATPLHMACQKGHIRVVETLLDAGADPTAQTLSGEMPLLFACKGNHPAVVRRLLRENRGGRLATADSLGYASLVYNPFGLHIFPFRTECLVLLWAHFGTGGVGVSDACEAELLHMARHGHARELMQVCAKYPIPHRDMMQALQVTASTAREHGAMAAATFLHEWAGWEQRRLMVLWRRAKRAGAMHCARYTDAVPLLRGMRSMATHLL
jgi:ankyrin repeat protein